MSAILCIEDNLEIQILVQAALDQHQVTLAGQILEGRNLLTKNKYDLLILDVELPDGDGLKLLAELSNHAGGFNTPVFILTGKSEMANKVIAFSLGADDFISKPFDPIELKARVNAKLKKLQKSQEQQNTIKLKDLLIDTAKQRVFLTTSGKQLAITLTSLEFRLLLIFARSPDMVFSRQQLLDKVWGPDVSITDRTVDTHVNHLRKKIKDSQVKIETVLNEGYRLLI
jgi:DNA-binding response OmpR family regulator